MDRRAIAVSGIVQGVGFRPFVYDLATRLGLNGFVRNETGGVLIEVEGESDSLDRFLGELTSSPPPLARIDEVQWSSTARAAILAFGSRRARAMDPSSIFISPDVATCDDCLRELFDPGDRRYRYPFLNCTQLRPAADDHSSSSLRPRADDHGVVSPCVRRAARSMKTRATAGSTPSRSPARRAARDCRRSTAAGKRSRPKTRWHAASRRSGGEDRRAQGPGRLSPRLRRRRRAGRGGTAQAQAPR